MSPVPDLALRLDDGFASLGQRFYTRVPPQPLPNPFLVCASPDALAEWGLTADAPLHKAFVERFSGGGIDPNAIDPTTITPTSPQGTTNPYNATYGYENFYTSGVIRLGANALIDVSGGSAGGLLGGTVNFRAPLLADGATNANGDLNTSGDVNVFLPAAFA